MTGHVIRRHVQPATHGRIVTLVCDCGQWTAMTMSRDERTVELCTAELLAHRGDAHGPDAYAGDA